MVKTPMRTETARAKKGRSSPVALGKFNPLLVLLALLALVGTYGVGVLAPFPSKPRVGQLQVVGRAAPERRSSDCTEANS